jgi:hypothetical protein
MAYNYGLSETELNRIVGIVRTRARLMRDR